MDILSATSKQAQAQSAPVKVESTASIRSVETTHETAKTAKDKMSRVLRKSKNSLMILLKNSIETWKLWIQISSLVLTIKLA